MRNDVANESRHGRRPRIAICITALACAAILSFGSIEFQRALTRAVDRIDGPTVIVGAWLLIAGWLATAASCGACAYVIVRGYRGSLVWLAVSCSVGALVLPFVLFPVEA